MNKREMIEAIALQCEVTKKVAEVALNGIINVVQDTLARGEEVSLSGFGKFYVRERAARNGINPKTMAAITIPTKNVPVFKAGKSFRDMIEES
jgi:DNA-binding protein HU-beta